MPDQTSRFFGWRVVAGAFVLAMFGWGLGFYGPPVYLHAVREARGWSVALVSAAVTAHYLFGVGVVANLPRLYARFGIPAVTRVGGLAVTLGVLGWASAEAPWQLFAATILTGGGWVTMAAAAINAIVARWFVVLRPKALSMAYNGASVGGVVFSPLWVWLIGAVGFQAAAVLVGAVTLVVVGVLSACVFNRSPARLGQFPDGAAGPPAAAAAGAPALPGRALWANRQFRTLALGMSLGLFAQIGLLAHLFSLIIPALGAGWAGILTGLATASAIVGRTLFGWLLPAAGDRRLAACLSYGVQMAGVAALMGSGMQGVPAIILGTLLFGFGIGNATSLPPLIAQREFAPADSGRAVALIVAIAQASYAFAPGAFGLLRAAGPTATALLGTTLAVQAMAIAAFLAGRQRGLP